MSTTAWVYIGILIALFGMLMAGQRRRRRAYAEEMVRIGRLGFGDEVMTTSGLYGTIVGRNDDGTVQLAIAPGVEVKWALAALRDAESLAAQYRQGIDGPGGRGGPDEPGDAGPGSSIQ